MVFFQLAGYFFSRFLTGQLYDADPIKSLPLFAATGNDNFAGPGL